MNMAERRVGGGLVALTVLAAIGVRLIWKGVTGNIARDVFGTPRFAAPGWYILAGTLLQVPLILYVAFVVHQGWGSP